MINIITLQPGHHTSYDVARLAGRGVDRRASDVKRIEQPIVWTCVHERRTWGSQNDGAQ